MTWAVSRNLVSREKTEKKDIYKLQRNFLFLHRTPRQRYKNEDTKLPSMMCYLSESSFPPSMHHALTPTTRALPMRPDPPDRRRPVRAHKPRALSRGNLFNLARAASRSDCWVPRSTSADKRIHQPKRHKNRLSPTYW